MLWEILTCKATLINDNDGDDDDDDNDDNE